MRFTRSQVDEIVGRELFKSYQTRKRAGVLLGIVLGSVITFFSTVILYESGAWKPGVSFRPEGRSPENR
jgi:hypothetical protein